jgi:hypothetical protein
MLVLLLSALRKRPAETVLAVAVAAITIDIIIGSFLIAADEGIRFGFYKSDDVEG